jgi:hypothetical protein
MTRTEGERQILASRRPAEFPDASDVCGSQDWQGEPPALDNQALSGRVDGRSISGFFIDGRSSMTFSSRKRSTVEVLGSAR